MYQQLGALLWPEVPRFDRGCWDFFDDDARARRDFEMWTAGMTTREGARAEPLPHTTFQEGPFLPEPRFMTVTMAFQFIQGSPTEQRIRQVCTIPEEALWDRSTFAMLLQNIGSINFASVIGDVAYVIPGTDDDYGLTGEDLRAEKFAYLRKIL
jgi:hypothetical protein